MYTEFIKQSSLYKSFFNFITTHFNYIFSCFNKNTTIYVLYKKNNVLEDNLYIEWDYYDDNNIEIFPYNWRFKGSRNIFQKEYSKLNDGIFILETKYSEYDIFCGPKSETNMIVNYLNNFFSNLQNDKKIFNYVIQDNCIPPDIDNVFIVPMFDIENMSR